MNSHPKTTIWKTRTKTFSTMMSWIPNPSSLSPPKLQWTLNLGLRIDHGRTLIRPLAGNGRSCSRMSLWGRCTAAGRLLKITNARKTTKWCGTWRTSRWISGSSRRSRPAKRIFACLSEPAGARWAFASTVESVYLTGLQAVLFLLAVLKPPIPPSNLSIPHAKCTHVIGLAQDRAHHLHSTHLRQCHRVCMFSTVALSCRRLRTLYHRSHTPSRFLCRQA